MQLILADDYDKMSRLAADIIKTKIKTKENTIIPNFLSSDADELDISAQPFLVVL